MKLILFLYRDQLLKNLEKFQLNLTNKCSKLTIDTVEKGMKYL